MAVRPDGTLVVHAADEATAREGSRLALELLAGLRRVPGGSGLKAQLRARVRGLYD